MFFKLYVQTVALMLHPLGFFRLPLKISLYKFILLLLIASSNVIVIIIGTFFGGRSPGIVVPSSEQKQSGRTQTAGSHGGARFGSLSISTFFCIHFGLNNRSWENVENMEKSANLPHEFSSEPSVQSFSPLQNKPRSMQFPSPHAKNPSWHNGSSVTKSGFTFRSLFLSLQFLTASFQSQVCFSMSKYKPAGQRIAWRPCKKSWSEIYSYGKVF